jgi:hypothetical protein
MTMPLWERCGAAQDATLGLTIGMDDDSKPVV